MRLGQRLGENDESLGSGDKPGVGVILFLADQGGTDEDDDLATEYGGEQVLGLRSRTISGLLGPALCQREEVVGPVAPRAAGDVLKLRLCSLR
ncbi:MAG: hypothetical protein ACAI37_17255, partial [Chthoniobacter sp.]